MSIDDAARATRKYWSAPHWEYQDVYFADHAGCDPENVGALYGSCAEANAACDRMNLLAVLEAIREPSDAMCAAGSQDHKDAWGGEAPIFEHSVYRAMIDALIAEVGK